MPRQDRRIATLAKAPCNNELKDAKVQIAAIIN